MGLSCAVWEVAAGSKSYETAGIPGASPRLCCALLSVVGADPLAKPVPGCVDPVWGFRLGCSRVCQLS